jgi:formyl-CoA transferase
VNSLDNLHEDEQIKHRGSLVETKHPAAGAMRMARPAVEFDGQHVRSGTFPARHSPTLGGDTRSVLEGLGVPADEIDALEERDRAQAKTLQAAIAAQSQP